MNVLIGFEFSGVVRRAFAARGHNAISIDLQPSLDNSPDHYICDIYDWLADNSGWPDLAIFHPTCTYLCSSGLHWNKRVPGRAEKTEAAIVDVLRLTEFGIGRWAIENPIGCLSTRWRKPNQIIQPWQFGDPESKATCIWLHNVSPLVLGPILQKPASGRWENQTASGQNKLAPSADRANIRSTTYAGIANAMAVQWGGKL